FHVHGHGHDRAVSWRDDARVRGGVDAARVRVLSALGRLAARAFARLLNDALAAEIALAAATVLAGSGRSGGARGAVDILSRRAAGGGGTTLRPGLGARALHRRPNLASRPRRRIARRKRLLRRELYVVFRRHKARLHLSLEARQILGDRLRWIGTERAGQD